MAAGLQSNFQSSCAACAVQVCPASIEGTFFAVLMSVSNIGNDVSRFVGAGLTSYYGVTNTNFESLWIVVALRIVACGIPAVLALVLVPRGSVLDAATEFELAGKDEEATGGGGQLDGRALVAADEEQ